MGDTKPSLDADILVVGAGAAGLSAALAAVGGIEALTESPGTAPDAPRVLLLTRGRLGRDGASPLAQGGVAAALDADDSAELHAFDTILAGAGLSREDRVSILTTEGPGRVRELIGLGAQFDRDPSGSLELAMEGAHSRRRVIHAHGDRTGAEVTHVLSRAVRGLDSIRVVEDTEAEDLITDGERACGVRIRGTDGSPGTLRAPAVILATGGLCHLYLRTTTPPSTTGDGIAMAIRAGAQITDMEFVQFHPTAMAVDADPMPLVTEAIRGEGARLVDAGGRGVDFPDAGGDLSARDVVARTLWGVIQRGDRVFLDARSAPGSEFPDRFPGVFQLCRRHGLDPRRDLIPVTPAAHYHMGGIKVDEVGRTSLPGLWAAGEVASTGVHGANRLASNSLLEGLVFGARAGASARRALPATSTPGAHVESLAPSGPDDGNESVVAAEFQALRALLWDEVGVVRDAGGLGRALGQIDRMASRPRPDSPGGRRLGNALLVARRIVEAALAREESRGSHFRSDFPTPHTRITT